MISVDRKKCIYCGGCVSVCPKNALTLKETYIECDPNLCISCGTCALFCPVKAIEVEGKNV
ncbi:MAG: 4Fe-4S binding protein [archaeon]